MMDKIIDSAQLKAIVDELKSQDKRIVFTNGCFELLHRGHVRCLQAAKQHGDILVVGLNSDSSLAALKGAQRPLQPEGDRAEVLAALACVDFVVIFDELDPLNLVNLLKPNVLVKGGDYSKEGIVGAKEVESWGGKVIIVPLVTSSDGSATPLSTSATLARIRRQ